jgi:hypothetical protein
MAKISTITFNTALKIEEVEQSGIQYLKKLKRKG